MSKVLDPFRFLLITVAGWMNEQQRLTIEYLREENRVLGEQLGDRRLRFNDEQRIRLAAKAKGLKRKLLPIWPSFHRKKVDLKPFEFSDITGSKGFVAIRFQYR